MKKHIRNRHTLRGNIVLIATPIVFLVVGIFLVWCLHLWIGFVLIGTSVGWLFGIGTMYKLDQEWLMDVGFRFGKEQGEYYMYFEHFKNGGIQ